MAFVVATKDSGGAPQNTAAIDAPATTTTVAQSPQEREAALVALGDHIPTTEEMAMLRRSGDEGLSWQLFDEAVIHPSEAQVVCATEGSGGTGAYGRQWALVDGQKGLHGSTMIRVIQFDSPEAANASVVSRTVDTYQSCYLGDLEDELRTQAGTNDVDPARIVQSSSTEGDLDAMTYISTEEGFRVGGGECTSYVESTWQQYGDRVVQTMIEVCGQRLPDDRLQELADLVDTKMAS